MGDRVDQEVAMSQQDKEIKTEAARQAHYIRWAQIMKVLDPCGHQRGYQRIVAIYTKYLMTGFNFRNKDFLSLATVQGYASSINLLFKLRDMKPPNVKRYLINYPYLSDYGQTIFCLSFPSRDRATAPGRYEQFYFIEHVPYPQK
jgi:hypothetical protein